MYLKSIIDCFEQGSDYIQSLSAIKVRIIILMMIYNLLKLALTFKLMLPYNINPWIFGFLDFVTVPAYVICWDRVFSIFTGKTEEFCTVVKWSIFTFFASTAPYLYAVWTGRKTFPEFGWILLLLVVILPFVNQIRKIMSIKNNG